MNFIFDPSLVLYLPLHELAGGSLMSRDACGHLCTVAGAGWRPEGRTFDGLDDYINIDAVVSNMVLTNAGSLEAWIYSEEPNDTSAAFVCFGDTDAQTFVYYAFVSGKIWAACYNAGVAQWEFASDDQVDDYQKWSHIALVQDGVEPVLYFNSEKPAQTFSISTDKTVWLADASGIDNGRIACRVKNGEGVSYPFEGRIGEVRIYNRALSPLEIQQNYLATKWRY